MNALTLTLTNFLAIFSLGYTNLSDATIDLALTLLAIEFVLFGIYFAFGARNFVDVFFKILFIGFWWWVINAFPALMTMVMNSFISWGAVAGGAAPAATSALMLDPSAIASFGMTAADPIILAMNQFGLTDVGSKVIYGLLALIVVGLFFVIAIQVFITILEFYLVVALVSVLLPFAYIKRTAFLAEKAIGAVVSFGIKLMVLAFIITVAQPVLAGLTLTAPVTYNSMFALILTVGGLAVLVLHAPGVAAGIMAGSPSLTAGSVATTAMAGGAATMAGGGAAMAAARLGGSATLGASRLTGAAASGGAAGKLASNVHGGGPLSTARHVATGAAQGVGSSLAQSARQGSSNLTAPIKSSFQAGARGGVGQSSGAGGASASNQVPSWAARSMANVSNAIRLSSHSSGPSGGGSNFRL